MRAITMIVAIALGATVAACAFTPDPSNVLDGKTFEVRSYGISPDPGPGEIVINPNFERRTWITFQSGRITGTTGCGALHGTYRSNGSSLAIDARWVGDRRSCSKTQLAQIPEFIKALNAASSAAYQERFSIMYEGVDESGQPVMLDLGGRSAVPYTVYDSAGESVLSLTERRPGRDLSELDNTFWQIVEIDGMAAPRGAYLQFEDSGIAVEYPPCRTIWFHHDLLDPSLKIKLTNSRLLTGDFGPDCGSLDEAETHYTEGSLRGRLQQTMESITHYQVTRDAMTAWDESGAGRLVLQKLQRDGVQFQRWRIVQFRDLDGIVTSPASFIAEALFMPTGPSGGDLSGRSGCGGLGGDYEIDGQQVRIRAGWGGTGWCPNESFRRSGCVVEALERASHFIENGGRVTLFNEQREPEIVLEPWPGAIGVELRSAPMEMEDEDSFSFYCDPARMPPPIPDP